MNNYYNRIMNRVPNSKTLVQKLSLSEHIPPYSKREFDMFLGYEYQTFIGLIYETAFSLHDRFWDGYALTHCFLRNIKEFIKVFRDINEECLANQSTVSFFKNIGSKVDNNIVMYLLYTPGSKTRNPRFKIEAYERLSDREYPHIMTSVDIYEDGRIENKKSSYIDKGANGEVTISEIPDNIKPHIILNDNGVQATRDILAYIFEKINEKETVRTSQR